MIKPIEWDLDEINLTITGLLTYMQMVGPEGSVTIKGVRYENLDDIRIALGFYHSIHERLEKIEKMLGDFKHLYNQASMPTVSVGQPTTST